MLHLTSSKDEIQKTDNNRICNSSSVHVTKNGLGFCKGGEIVRIQMKGFCVCSRFIHQRNGHGGASHLRGSHGLSSLSGDLKDLQLDQKSGDPQSL